jgi:hypothetical protein
MLIRRLQDHVENKVELTSTQVTAALGLLKKCVADLASVQVDVSGNASLTVHVIRSIDEYKQGLTIEQEKHALLPEHEQAGGMLPEAGVAGREPVVEVDHLPTVRSGTHLPTTDVPRETLVSDDSAGRDC